jgi:thiamine-phosphate pyrophosphorylase
LRERLILVTDRRLGDVPRVIAAALAALPAGAALVLLREKDLGGRELFALAEAVVEVCRGRARVVIADRADVALAVGADGLHLPEVGFTIEDARRLIGLVGVSRHDIGPSAADYVMLGPIFDTPSKRVYGAPLGLGVLAGSGAFAVGGIDGPARARLAIDAGARGVAVIRAVMGAEDPGAAAAAIVEAISDPRT